MAQRDSLRDEVDDLSLVRRILTVEVKKARQELTGARAEIGLLARQVTALKRSAEESERRLNDVQYELDGVHARATRLTSRESRRQELVVSFIV